jgi:hypothetical protein
MTDLTGAALRNVQDLWVGSDPQLKQAYAVGW